MKKKHLYLAVKIITVALAVTILLTLIFDFENFKRGFTDAFNDMNKKVEQTNK